MPMAFCNYRSYYGGAVAIREQLGVRCCAKSQSGTELAPLRLSGRLVYAGIRQRFFQCLRGLHIIEKLYFRMILNWLEIFPT